jgi:MtrB/PioB family decaheme-associated outer membrane protein
MKGGRGARWSSSLPALAFSCALAAAPLASAEQEFAGGKLSGSFEGGGRIVTGNTDSAKFEEYRDLHSGAFGAGEFLLEDAGQRRYLRGWLEDIGEDDQRYRLEAGEWGRWGLELEYDELPHEFSELAETPYGNVDSGELVLPPSFARPPVPDLASELDENLQPAGLGFLWRTGTAQVRYEPRRDIELSTRYRVQDKQGTRPLALGFGSPGGRFVNVPAPIDERIFEVRSDATLARERWSLGFDYTGSFFDNHMTSVTVDNPLQGTDAVGASSRGRFALAPDNSAHSVSLSGSSLLPAPFPVRATGTVGWGLHLQDDDFLPHTINSAIAGDPLLALPASDLDGKVRTLLGNATLSAQPARGWDLDARYRIYDYDDKTDSLELPAVVVNDASVSAETRFSTPFDYRRQLAELEASYRICEPAEMSLAYRWESWRRSWNREVRHSNEQGPDLKLDYLPARWLQLRAGYSFGWRERSDYHSNAYLTATLPPADLPAAESDAVFPPLRDFDLERRLLHQVDLLARILPREDLAVAFSGALYAASYPDAEFGVQDDRSWSVGTDASWTPLDWLALSFSYTFDHDRLAQDARNRPSLPDDPSNDFDSRTTNLAHDVGVESELTLIPDRLSGSVGYRFQRGRDETDSQGAQGAAVDYPTVRDRLHVAHAELRYRVSEPLELRARYAFEDWSHDDFRYDGLRPSSPAISPNDVFLGDEVADYQAHIVSLSAIFRF